MAYKQQTFLTVLEAWKFKSKVLESFQGGSVFQFINGNLFAVSSHGRRDKESLQGLFYKGTNLIDEDSTLMPPSNSSYFPKAPYSNIITRSRWVGFQHTNLGRHRHSHQTVITERWETTELKLTNASDYCFEGFYTTSQGGESEEDISDQLSCEDGADGLGYKAARVDKVKNPSAIQETWV